jgi:hypothetical protein
MALAIRLTISSYSVQLTSGVYGQGRFEVSAIIFSSLSRRVVIFAFFRVVGIHQYPIALMVLDRYLFESALSSGA